MIRNRRQAAVARRRHEELMQAARAAEPGQRSSFIALAGDIAEEMREYEAIRAGQITVFEVNGVDDLGDSLVKARLAKGWTQRRLADGLGVSEQMVQKDEMRSYEHAGLARLAEVADVLGYELIGSLRPTSVQATPWTFVTLPSGITNVTISVGTASAASFAYGPLGGFSLSMDAWATPAPAYAPTGAAWLAGALNIVRPLQSSLAGLSLGHVDASAAVPLQEAGATF